MQNTMLVLCQIIENEHVLRASTLVCPGLSGAVWKELFSKNRQVDKCPNYTYLSHNWQMSLTLDLGAVVI